jgi:cell division septation protein DedD
VATHTRPQQAKSEMDRLRASGHRAFLVMRDGRTIVYVGPFPSKGNATEQLTTLRSRYQDCFIRTL